MKQKKKWTLGARILLMLLTSMCAKIYGKRSAKKKTNRIKGIIEEK